MIYLGCPALCVGGPNCSFRVYTGRGSSSTNLGNSVLTTGGPLLARMVPTHVRMVRSGRAQTSGFTPDLRRRLLLSRICVYWHPVKGL
jgi:hypothetical protein